MHRDELGLYLAVVSHARAYEVERMTSIVGDATWYVGEGEGAAYREAGAKAVVESGGLCVSRNAALRDAWKLELPCMELSDDLRKLEYAPNESRKSVVPVDIGWVSRHLLAALQSTGLHLAGVAPVANSFYYSAKKAYDMQAFIVGDLFIASPCDLYFDEELKLKEDYDYSLRHMTRYGAVVRCNSVLAHFVHRSNKGGAVEFRTPEREQDAIRYLNAKWPGKFRDNPKRPNEILLNKIRAPK